MSSNSSISTDALFRAVIDSAPDGIVLINQLGRIVLVNTRTEKLFGYERSELLLQPIEMLVPERLRGRHRGHRAGYISPVPSLSSSLPSQLTLCATASFTRHSQ